MDENSKIVDGGAAKTSTEDSPTTNPNPNSDVTSTTTTNSNSAVDGGGASVAVDADDGSDGAALSRQSSRTPFTNLSQVDADLALARTLQEQERAYMMLSMNGGGGGVGFGTWGSGIYIPDDDDDDFGDSHDHEYDDEDDDDDDDDDDEDNEEYIDHYDDEDEDAFDIHARDDSEDNDEPNVELDPSAYPDDEAYARALQDAEEREMAARLLAMAGITEREIVDVEDHRAQRENSQDTWEDVDPDELSYEELIALGDVVGTESRGLSADTIASLPSTNYKCQNNEETETDTCVICRLDYEDGDGMTTLPCKHAYHSECINNWLKINKACPVCSAEVSTSQKSE